MPAAASSGQQQHNTSCGGLWSAQANGAGEAGKGSGELLLKKGFFEHVSMFRN
jgi:hypothetical protein